MKTKYVLHGGSAQHQNERNDAFFEEILKDYSGKVKILLVHFASPPEKGEVNKARDVAQFERVKKNRELVFEVARLEEFVEQIKKADIIYMGGGTTSPLLTTLKNFSNLGEAFLGKTVAGESAGANSISAYCYSKSGGILEGLGLVQVRTLPHYEPGWEEKLKGTPEEIPMLLLPVYEYKVFYT